MARILLVDDDPEIIRLLKAYLEKAGCHVLTAHDGETALHTLRREKPDLLVLDLMLPDRDGWDLTRLIRADEQLAATPIIMLTARVADSDKIVGLEIGADDYITKPFNPREVVARVRALLRRSQRGSQAPKSQVLQVAEVDGLRRAGLLARGLRVAVAELPSVETGVDLGRVQALDAVGALLHHTTAADGHLGVHHQGLKLAIGVFNVAGIGIHPIADANLLVEVEVVETPHFERTVVGTVAGSDATVVSHLIQAFLAVWGSCHRTNIFAGRIVTMLAHHWLENHFRIIRFDHVNILRPCIITIAE